MRLDEILKKIKFSDIPGTKVETNTITHLLLKKHQEVKLYQDSLALEEVLKKVQNPRVLHLATHGRLFPRLHERSSIKKLRSFAGSQAQAADILAVRNNPMMRSGLALSAVGTYTKEKEAYTSDKQIEDGFFTAYEAQNLILDGTELVVLSACETAQGDVVDGEGVYGLQRGFLAAGAKAVLMSLWKVDDLATRDFMISFYDTWLESGDKRAAFRKAQETLRADARFASPIDWGAFVLVGE